MQLKRQTQKEQKKEETDFNGEFCYAKLKKKLEDMIIYLLMN